MIRLGLTGFPLNHSLSPKLHLAILRELDIAGEYRLYPIQKDDIDALIELTYRVKTGVLDGLNVTIPHKQAIIPLLDELSPSAHGIGAVNVIYKKGHQLIGHNTDAPGFMSDLGRIIPRKFEDKKALILGSGGAARAVAYGLLNDGWSVSLAIRGEDEFQAEEMVRFFSQEEFGLSLSYMIIDSIEFSQVYEEKRLVVNATPVGMYPDIASSPWPINYPFPTNAIIYDVVYNPRETRMIRDARAFGLRACTGIGMFVEQAALSFACWTGLDVSRRTMWEVLEA
jgi:shikimate dehydrogenase